MWLTIRPLISVRRIRELSGMKGSWVIFREMLAMAWLIPLAVIFSYCVKGFETYRMKTSKMARKEEHNNTEEFRP